MNPREKLLAAITGGLIGLLALYWCFSTVVGWFEDRDTRLTAAQRNLKLKEAELFKAQLAAKKLADFEQRSLPRDIEIAQSLYHTWLLQLAEKAGLKGANLQTLKPRANQRTYQALGFTLTAQADWSVWSAWFHAFQAEDRLHRIETFSLEPLPKSKSLLGTVTISALAVISAPTATELVPRSRERFGALADFQQPILQRNFFAPPNRAPRFEGSASQTAYLGRSWDHSMKAADPDPYDRLKFELLKSDVPDAKLDPTSGRISFTPSSKGEFKFEVQATDDGYPQQSSRQTIQLAVTDPPPPPPPPVEPPKKLAFDLAKYTYFTAVIEVNGQPEAWLHVRPSGEMKKVHPGDTISIGSMEGRIATINAESITIVKSDGQFLLKTGSILVEAMKLENATPPSPDDL